MLYSVKGELIHKELSLAVVECGGVGYACKTTAATISQLGSIGSKVSLFTYLYVREDALELFGFGTLAELGCFKMLITVSGVGPKAALSILSDISPERFALCVATGDAKSLTRAQGIGVKLAQRIVLELRDKVTKEQLAAGVSLPAYDTAEQAARGNAGEAISALVVLGYPQSEAARVIGKLAPETPVEDMIRHGLKALAGIK